MQPNRSKAQSSAAIQAAARALKRARRFSPEAVLDCCSPRDIRILTESLAADRAWLVELLAALPVTEHKGNKT